MQALLILEVGILLIVGIALLIVKRRQAVALRRQQEWQAFNRSLPVQIVCGDCMGDDILPRRTFLGIYERCSRCGGASYVLATALATNMLLHRAEQSSHANTETAESHVISIEEHRAAREDRNRKIAV
jgi:hypothetical protein